MALCHFGHFYIAHFLMHSIIFRFGGHVGGHIGFLSSPSFMPVCAGSFRNYRQCGNILIYDTSCCTRGGVQVTPRKSGQFHSLSPTIKAKSSASPCTQAV